MCATMAENNKDSDRSELRGDQVDRHFYPMPGERLPAGECEAVEWKWECVMQVRVRMCERM